MLALVDTNDRLRITTSSAADVDVVASFVEASTATPPVVGTVGKQLTAISSATTTTIVTEPGASTYRNIKQVTIRNKHASTANDITVIFQDNATNYEVFKTTLNAGDTLEYQEGVGWFVLTNENRLDVNLVVKNDVTFATTAFADVTGLTYPVESGKHYGFDVRIFHIENASTTGFRLGINGPSMTAMRAQGQTIFAGSLTAATQAAALADVAAVDTSVTGATTSSAGTPQVVEATMAGWINPSAAGTFAVRVQSEVAVAAGVTVKAGSWCHLWEFDN